TITGDIAFSGKADEYYKALGFILKLEEELKKEIGEKHIEYIVAPGNHDCDFELSDKLREIVLNGGKIKDDEIDFEVIESFTKVQKNFDDFAINLNEEYCANEIQNIYEYIINDKKIAFQVFNSSWMSKKNESQ